MRSSRTKTLHKEAVGVAFVLPALIPLLLFTIYPVIRSFILSFFSYNMITPMKFVGLKNYRNLFASTEIWDTILRNVEYAVAVIPITLAAGFMLSVMLSGKSKANIFYRTLYFAPHVTSMVAMSSVWLFIFHPQYGALNAALSIFGIPPIRWLNDANTAFGCICAVTIWRMIGYDTLVFIGGVQNISKDVFEAATIDGATSWQRLRYIIFPLVSPTTFMLLILNTIDVMQMFTTINVLTDGGPANSTQNLVVMLQDYAFNRFQIGYASAISNILFVLILVIHIFQRILERKVQYDQ